MAQFFSGRGNSFKCLRFGRGRGAGALKRGRYLGLLSGIVGHGLLGWPALVRPILVAECAETLGNHDDHNGDSGSAFRLIRGWPSGQSSLARELCAQAKPSISFVSHCTISCSGATVTTLTAIRLCWWPGGRVASHIYRVGKIRVSDYELHSIKGEPTAAAKRSMRLLFHCAIVWPPWPP